MRLRVEEGAFGWCVVIDDATGIGPVWASIEGPREDMVELCESILERSLFKAKRCAAAGSGDIVRLWSPRNETGDGAMVPRAVAEEMAREFLGRARS